MKKMTTQQMALALYALGDFSVKVRPAGDWYAMTRAEIKDGSCLSSPSVSASSPDKAIRALFAIYAAEGAQIVLDAFRDNKRMVTWVGFMWRDIS